MQVTGIIAEFNPFHEGHQYLIRKAKETADYVIIVMSGDYVQRGEPALLPKHLRAKTALENGADLVFELPVHIAASSAEGFASGAVSLLSSLGIVDSILFGAETDRIDLLQKVAYILEHETPEFSKELSEQLKSGKSYPEARMYALKKVCNLDTDITELVLSPNNILGIEYCRAIERYHSSIRPNCIRREGASYHDTQLSKQIPSATAIREHIKINQTIISQMLQNPLYQDLKHAIETKQFILPSDFDLLYRSYLLKTSKKVLIQYADLNDRLANRIENNKYNYTNFDEYVSSIKTRDLTYSRVSRSLLHALLEITPESYEATYARILGFRKEASPLLHELKKNASVLVITKISNMHEMLDSNAERILQKTIDASNLYEAVLCDKCGKRFQHEFQKQLVIV